MRSVRQFNEAWEFSEGFDEALVNKPIHGKAITLPHNAVDLPYNYFDEKDYQKAFTYQKKIDWEPAFEDKEVIVRFEAAMADAVVYLNGKKICAHVDGYTPFEARLTEHLTEGENILTVKVDGSENPEIPPFGGRIDYLTYAGIYRGASLQVRSPISIQNVKVETPNVLDERKSVAIKCFIFNPNNLEIDGTLRATITSAGGALIADKIVSATSEEVLITLEDLQGIELWDIDNPTLYAVTVELKSEHAPDQISRQIGFRSAEFKPDGFFLNGKRLKLMGLNRHQSFPYSGYAQGRAAQEKDAEIVKYDLSCNVVRTSHYPQCPYFLDHCDRIGLLVLTEIPGWQHIGDKAWQAESVRNVKRLIERDWNHPSIITWGVRINESDDDHDFYTATNAQAHALDSIRQTSGIRKHPNSELLEDIYTMNDFTQGREEMSHNNSPRIILQSQREQTGLKSLVPYMVTECNGHMYPTKVFDQEQRQAEHVTRHLNVLNQMFGDPQIAGLISWCMFDYHTHKDFGSGDGICYHGVMTMFREPKFAAQVYASQGDPKTNPVLQPVTFYARGERNIGGVLPLIILTNADEIEFRFEHGKNYRFTPAIDRYPHLPHAPIIIEREDLPPEAFGKWGADWNDLEIVAFVKGEEIKRMKLSAAPVPTTLEVHADELEISSDKKDCVRVMVRALDQCGNKMPFFSEQIQIEVSGSGYLIGPETSQFLGGSTGFWVQSDGTEGQISISVHTDRLDARSITIEAVADKVAPSEEDPVPISRLA